MTAAASRQVAADTNLRSALDALGDHPPIPADGTCRRAPGLWWSASRYERQAAAAICVEACPALAACRALADSTRPTVGVWAGVDCHDAPLSRSPFDPHPARKEPA